MSLDQDVADGSRHTLALDEVDDLDGSLGDVRHVLAMRKLTKERGRSNDDVNTINA